MKRTQSSPSSCAFTRSDPYEIWGTGEQDRNFTYVQDIVDAMVLASERIDDGAPINAGRNDRITINAAAELVFELMSWKPKRIVHDVSKPQGVASRAADLTRASSLLGWEPKITYKDGFGRTINWYITTHDQSTLTRRLGKLLFERNGGE